MIGWALKFIGSRVTPALAPKLLLGLVCLTALAGATAGVQSLRLAWCKSDTIDLTHQLSTARQGRDAAVAEAEGNHQATIQVRNRLTACVAARAADAAAAQREVEAAIEARARSDEALRREMNDLRRIYESDASARDWRDTPVPAPVGDWLRRNPRADSGSEDGNR